MSETLATRLRGSRTWVSHLLVVALLLVVMSPTPARATSARSGTPRPQAHHPAPASPSSSALYNIFGQRAALARSASATSATIDRLAHSKTTSFMLARSTKLYSMVASSTKQESAAVVEAFVSSPPPQPSPGLFTTVPQMLTAESKSVYVQILTSNLAARVRRATITAQELNAQLATLSAALDAVTAVSVAQMANQVALEIQVTSDTSAIVSMDRHLHIPVSPALVEAPAGLLTIMGPSILSASQLAAWYESRGYQSSLSIPIENLAQMYLDEAKAEGVRGDVAFIQATLETGGFAILSGRYNFAGIGACDSCSSGYNFPSLRLGVRAQIELLKAYADPSYSQKKTARRAAYKWINTVPVKGTRPTWYSLGSSWSSDPAYGEHILGLYLEALDLALVSVPSPISTTSSSLPVSQGSLIAGTSPLS